jgi:hypothetical protein
MNLAFGGLFYSIPEQYLGPKNSNLLLRRSEMSVCAAKELALHSGYFVGE